MDSKEFKDRIESSLTKAERDIYISIKKKLLEGKSLSAKELEQYKELSEKIESAQKAKSDEKAIWKMKEVAEFFDVSVTTLMTWEKFSDFDRTAKIAPGTYDIRKLFRWWYNHFVSNEQMLIEIQEAKRRKEVAQAEIKELEAKEIKGELIRKTQVVEDIAYCIAIFKRRLMSLPKSLPPLIAMQDERSIQKILHKEISEILNDLSRDIEAFVIEKKKEIKHR